MLRHVALHLCSYFDWLAWVRQVVILWREAAGDKVLSADNIWPDVV